MLAKPKEASGWSHSPLLRVLVVEDDDGLKEAIRKVLFRSGMDVDTAGTGDAALELTAQFAYNIVLIDMRIPGVDGITLAEQMQQIRRPPKVILMTGFPEWDVQERARSAGIASIIEKPIDLVALPFMIRRERIWDQT